MHVLDPFLTPLVNIRGIPSRDYINPVHVCFQRICPCIPFCRDVSFVVADCFVSHFFFHRLSLSSANGQAYISDKTIKVRPTRRTSSFYMRMVGENGDVLDVFPRTLLHNNPRTGLAPVVVMIEDGTKRQLYTSENDNYYDLWFDGKQQRVDIYWAGNSLNIMSGEAEKQ